MIHFLNLIQVIGDVLTNYVLQHPYIRQLTHIDLFGPTFFLDNHIALPRPLLLLELTYRRVALAASIFTAE